METEKKKRYIIGRNTLGWNFEIEKLTDDELIEEEDRGNFMLIAELNDSIKEEDIYLF